MGHSIQVDIKELLPTLKKHDNLLAIHEEYPNIIIYVEYVDDKCVYENETDEYYSFESILAWTYLPKFSK